MFANKRFTGNESTIADVARYMIRHGLSPQDVLAAYNDWLAERLAEMEPAGDELRVPSSEFRVVQPATRNAQLANPPRHKAGDCAQLPHACPSCRATIEICQLCHISSPVWRTQLACMDDACAWHGKSRLPIDALIAEGAANLKHHVTEG